MILYLGPGSTPKSIDETPSKLFESLSMNHANNLQVGLEQVSIMLSVQWSNTMFQG